MSGAIWRVEGFDGATRLFMCDLPATHITSGSLDALLRTLVAKHGLTDDETVACFPATPTAASKSCCRTAGGRLPPDCRSTRASLPRRHHVTGDGKTLTKNQSQKLSQDCVPVPVR